MLLNFFIFSLLQTLILQENFVSFQIFFKYSAYDARPSFQRGNKVIPTKSDISKLEMFRRLICSILLYLTAKCEYTIITVLNQEIAGILR